MTDFLFRVLVCSCALLPMAHAQSPKTDPNLYLEQVDGAKAMQWVRGQNAITLARLGKDPAFEPMAQDALAIAESKDRIANPEVIGSKVYNFWRDAEHVRGIWRRTSLADYRSESPNWQTVLDLDQLAASEHANWIWQKADCVEPSEDRCLIFLSDGGEDASTVREFDLSTGQFVAGGFRFPKGKQDAAWVDPDTVLLAREWSKGELTASSYPYVVKQITRGQNLSEATEVFRGTKEDVGAGPTTSVDALGHRLNLISQEVSFFETAYFLDSDHAMRRIGLPLKSRYRGLLQGRVIAQIKEDWRAGTITVPQGSLVSFDYDAFVQHPEELVPTVIYSPGPRESFQEVTMTKDALIVTIAQNVKGRARIYRPESDGTWSHQNLDLPDNVSIDLVDANEHGREAFLAVTGFLTPNSLWEVDAATGSAQKLKERPAKFDASNDVVEQMEAVSSDGTQIPYFIVHPKDMVQDGSNPVILYAYGGFEVSMTPYYSGILGKLWLEQRGVYVLANIRGGGEFGPAWHDAGLKTQRQLVFDDFAAVGRDLISRKITSPRHLGIEGGSNGGLLMGVELTQHPELWNAVDIQVPLLDMMRYEQIAAGASWVGEYGSVKVPKEKAFLAHISPYANVHTGVKYPEPFIWTTTKDDRVGPQHARKFAALFEEKKLPYLYYEVIEGGHASGANLKESAKTTALEYVYFKEKLTGP